MLKFPMNKKIKSQIWRNLFEADPSEGAYAEGFRSAPCGLAPDSRDLRETFTSVFLRALGVSVPACR